MMKTPVSILQEYSVLCKLGIPDYETSWSGPSHNMSFECQVKVGSECVTGIGFTKKDAKHNAANKMLEKFGMDINNSSATSNLFLLPNKTKKEGPFSNFIGKLNEFCSRNKYPLPTYCDGNPSTARFCIVCKLLDFKALGFGGTKKEAKQDSAKQMLDLIRNADLSSHSTDQLSTVNGEFDRSSLDAEKVLQTYTDLMKNLSISNSDTKINNNIETKRKTVDISTWDDLVTYMNEKGLSHKVTVFQPLPLMLCLKINDHTFINYGETKEEIYRKFVTNVVELLERGTDFNEPLLLLKEMGNNETEND